MDEIDHLVSNSLQGVLNVLLDAVHPGHSCRFSVRKRCNQKILILGPFYTGNVFSPFVCLIVFYSGER